MLPDSPLLQMQDVDAVDLPILSLRIEVSDHRHNLPADLDVIPRDVRLCVVHGVNREWPAVEAKLGMEHHFYSHLAHEM